MERKQQIRVEQKNVRNLLTRNQREEYSASICHSISESDFFQKADTVCFYYPFGTEVSLLPLFEIALQCKKQTAFPIIISGIMEFRQVVHSFDFCRGAYGIMEPTSKQNIAVPNPLVLVPGLGFDKNGNRIGYGKGFYDRYFAQRKECQKVGIGYHCQLREEIPTDCYDIAMNLVITEQELIRCSKE
ncbi:MAG: 5-formyltetrahydrofolate cyclo-ligase [Lachnospiraceae bacterium]